MRRITRTALALALSLSATASHALTMATWNMEWLMDKPLFDRWAVACPDPKAPQPVGLPYCDVFEGDHDWSHYEKKLQGLRETFAALDKKGVDIVALQEVANADSVRQVLPPGWTVKTSAEFPDGLTIPQQVGVAWKEGSVKPSEFKLFTDIAGAYERPLRPGLTFKLDLAGGQVDVMVVHLKAGCRTNQIDQPKTANQKQACPALAQQVLTLEKWIDAPQHAKFIIAGDFNRTLLDEVAKYPEPQPRFAHTEAYAVEGIFPEWNDNDPEGKTLFVVPHASYVKDGQTVLKAGDYYCGRTKGIDHIVLSAPLKASLDKTRHQPWVMEPQGFVFEGKKLPVKQEGVVPPSDHCARYVELN